MNPAMALDLLLAVLLFAAIAYAWRLDRRLATLAQEKAQLIDLVRDFNQAAERADRGIGELKANAEELARMLEAQIAKGQGVREDLGYLVERAEPLVDRLQSSARGRAAGPARGADKAGMARTETAGPSPAERELLKALAGLR